MILPIACLEQRCGCLSHNGFLTKAGYRWVDMGESVQYLDMVRSVSAMPEPETIFVDDVVIDQEARFLQQELFNGEDA